MSGAGTGGTIAGTSVYLKGVQPDLQVVLADPEGSGLYNKVRFTKSTSLWVVNTSQVKEGVMYDPRESEGRRRRHQVDTVVEGMRVSPSSHYKYALIFTYLEESIASQRTSSWPYPLSTMLYGLLLAYPCDLDY